MVRFGQTWVLCTVSLEERVPPFLRGSGSGWVTAEYGMLPRSTNTRQDREAARGRQSGRSQEIQRLIGRALRSVTNLDLLGERTFTVDCDVIKADGGTRTAAITGSCVALVQALNILVKNGTLGALPLSSLVAAVSEWLRGRGRNAMAIWQDLIDDHGFSAKYASVRRYVAKLRGATPAEARVVIATIAGEEGQVDYGDGPMVRWVATGKYRRTRLFVFTLAHSRKAVRVLTWRSSTQIWCELHERAFRRLGGPTKVVVLRAEPRVNEHGCG